MGSIPSRREPAAVIRAQLDCTPAQVMTLSLPLATASARMKSSFRALLPPKASPVWSSRLTKRRGPPSSAARVGISSNGVGRWASGCRSKWLSASSKTVMGSVGSPSTSPAPAPPQDAKTTTESAATAATTEERSAFMGEPPKRASLCAEPASAAVVLLVAVTGSAAPNWGRSAGFRTVTSSSGRVGGTVTSSSGEVGGSATSSSKGETVRVRFAVPGWILATGAAH